MGRRLVFLAALLALAPGARAQQGPPHIGYVYPAGGQRGTSFPVKVGGQYLDRVFAAHVSGTGAEAAVVEHVKPMTQRQFNELRERVQELQKKGRTLDVLQEIAAIREKLAAFVRRPAAPAIAESVTLKITVDPNAEPGDREIRLATPQGLTNPLLFEIGRLPEFRENEASPPGPGAGLIPGAGRSPRPTFRAMDGQPDTRRTDPTSITLPGVANGWISPGGVDRFRFQARQGQQLVAAARARALIPYLADAVPGWFQATLALTDAEGRELAYDDDFQTSPDPVLCYRIPRDGEYLLEIKDSIYRGREDFVYRIAIGELPFVTGIFPLGGPAGERTEVRVQGWNLPADRLTMDAGDRAPGVHPLLVRAGEWESNRVAFAVGALPECREAEPSLPQRRAQKVTLPVIVNGRIEKPGDWDVFSFQGRAGTEVIAEVRARRLGSPLDSLLKLTDAAGRQLALCDDQEDRGAGLVTHHADSLIRAAIPKDGTYLLAIRDTQHRGGPEYAYRLRISRPRPDFELRVVPASITARAGASVPITVHALRQDGFSGEIALTLEGMPLGFTLSGARVPANQDRVRLTLAAPPLPLREPVSLHLEGRAVIEGKDVRRAAVPAEDMMQAFAYQHLVPAQELRVAVVGRFLPGAGGLAGAQRGPAILSPTPVRIPAGGAVRVEVGVPAKTAVGNTRLELSEPPEGITLQEVSPAGAASVLLLRADDKAKPGLEGNLIVSIFLERAQAEGRAPANANRARVPVGFLPAIPFRVE
ncbi:MAG: hypothetical protein HY321_22555 [Armatimonadetes bacterium]|nr:hypothetical protein [Armatimonadota bacterium]